MSIARFLARVWVGTKEDGIVEKSTWDLDLTPLDHLSASEWGSNHLDDLVVEDLRDLMPGLPEENFEVLFEATITGSTSRTLDGDEYEEYLTIISHKFQALPEKWLYGKREEGERRLF